MKRKFLFFSVVGIISIPFCMWGAWLITPNKKLVLAIVDKTESMREGRHHMALTWILNNEKYSKTHKKSYDVSNDYYGFFPIKKSEYKIKGLERFSSAQLEQLSDDCDLAYYVDTYGVYSNDLADQNNDVNKGTGFIYGGMSQQDLDFLKKIKSKKKLIIAEYNTLQSPTPIEIRKQFETAFGLKCSGWTCRYFESLDPVENKDLPMWVVNNYKLRNAGKWPFTKPGLAFVSTMGEVVVLEDLVHLNNPVPFISIAKSEQNYFKVDDNVKFPFWFDIIIPDTAINKVVANFNISYTQKGREQLVQHNIPLNIPAIISHEGDDYGFHYFSGSFCSTNKLSSSSSHYKWISAFKSFLYNEDDTMESSSFFWTFYRPLMSTILGNYYKKIKTYRGK
jgi:hypothetical protein